MTYEEALVYIHGCAKHGIKLGLVRIGAILERLGHPEEQFRSVHVAGTNGKGSTTAMLDAVLREAGYKTGRFNSPHLSDYRERITVDGRMIAKEELVAALNRLKPALEAITPDFGPPTEFEVGTALALLYFAAQKVEIAVIEVGMGGRFDATNVIKPVLSIITHIALDHREYLGDTLTQIAFEKAGIIKEGVPAVSGVQEPEVETFLREIAGSCQAPYRSAGMLATADLELSSAGTSFKVLNSVFGEIPVRLGLIGEHQADNALNVIAAVEFLKKADFNISRVDLLNGLAKASWPGRLELIDRYAPIRLYLDGAHNPDGARALVAAFRKIYPGQRADLLVGILKNRPLTEMAEIFSKLARRVIVTRVPDPKSASETELAEIFRQNGLETVAEPDPEKALRLLRGSCRQLGVITGSLYLVGFLRTQIFKDGD